VADLLLHPALPLAVAALLCAFVPGARRPVLVARRPAGRARPQLAQLEVGTSVTGPTSTFDVEVPMRVDRLALPFGWCSRSPR
jgi:hypothetical protein